MSGRVYLLDIEFFSPFFTLSLRGHCYFVPSAIRKQSPVHYCKAHLIISIQKVRYINAKSSSLSIKEQKNMNILFLYYSTLNFNMLTMRRMYELDSVNSKYTDKTGVNR